MADGIVPEWEKIIKEQYPSKRYHSNYALHRDIEELHREWVDGALPYEDIPIGAFDIYARGYLDALEDVLKLVERDLEEAL
jgi:hypothetical protein